MNKTYLFLDFDGVLNSNEWIWSHPERDDEFIHIDPSRVEIINKIVDTIDCDVVISSAWRIIHTLGSLRRGLMSKNATFARRVIDKTDSVGSVRGFQIQRWLDENASDGHKFVILDDSTDMAHLMPFLVRTNPDTGITEEDIQRVLDVIDKQK